ncbi:MAG: hypothetical protein MR395_09920 [Caecibacter massiliensis]|nr:hypothetical protein [Caecibacter massiliensis]
MKKFHVQPLYFRSLEDTILAIYDHLASYAVRSDVPGFIKDRVWKLMGHGRPGFSGGKRKKKKKKHPKNKSQMKYETKHVLDLIDSIQGKR